MFSFNELSVEESLVDGSLVFPSTISIVLVFLFLSISHQYLLMDIQFFSQNFGWDWFSLGFPPFPLTSSLLPCQLPHHFSIWLFFKMSMSKASECSTVCSFIFSVSRSALSGFTSKCEPLQDLHNQKDNSKASFSSSSTNDK